MSHKLGSVLLPSPYGAAIYLCK